ncbi:MAG: hypothetical protein Q9224_007686, partial [Gallowayella concinna]
NRTVFPWASNPSTTEEVSWVKVEGENGISSIFRSNTTNEELDAHCLNIELMRQRLRGLGNYKMSSNVQGTNKHYDSFFPANMNEKDLDVWLEIANRMRDKIHKFDKEPDEVVEVRKQN